MSTPAPSPFLSLRRDAEDPRRGRIAERTLNLGGEAEIRRYAYDSAGRLARVTDERGGLLEAYQYDGEGRRLADINPQRFRGERRYTYLPGNRLGQAGTAQYGHDRAGFRNLKVEATSSNPRATRYHYEPSGLLLAVDLPDGRRIEYAYDASGLRREKRIDGKLVEAYRWIDPLRLSEFWDGREWWRLAYDPEQTGHGGRTPVGVTNGDSSYLLLCDQVGTPLALAITDGHIVQTIQYDSFGSLLQVRGDVVRLPIGFAGGLFDADTGLTRFVWRDYDADIGRFVWRDYDADIGRFTALDPMGAKGGDSDWYGYCVDDPVNRVDAWGLWTVNAGVGGSASGFGVGGTASGSIGRDGEGNWAWQGTVGVGPAAGYGASVGGFAQATNATRMDDLAGEGTQAGWSVGEIPVGKFKMGPAFGVDKVTGDDYEGMSGQYGWGAGTPEVRAYKTNTWSKTIFTTAPTEASPPDDFDLYNRD